MHVISSVESKRPVWQAVVLLTLGFWLSASLVLDWVIMPSLYISGMMTQAGFATAGYVVFWNFNRIELLAAAVILTGFLALKQTHRWGRNVIVLSILLLGVSLLDTYVLTPQMSAIGLQLNLFQATAEIPQSMDLLHGAYWFLESVKLAVCGTLLYKCWEIE
jgi:hypothetical protein